jgi:hypothetical protein
MTSSKTILLWCTFGTCALILDYALFTTGNPSVTYSVLGGWFLIPLAAAVLVSMFYAYRAGQQPEGKRGLLLHLMIVGGFCAALFVASPYARQFAQDRLQIQLTEFVKNPTQAKADTSEEVRSLMAQLNAQKYSMERETFIPTFRRLDYLFKTDSGTTYRLVMKMSWNGTPEISLRRVES